MDALKQPAQTLPLRPPKVRPIQTLTTYKAGTNSQALMEQVRAFELKEKLPTLRPHKHRQTARVIRYNLLCDENELAVMAMAQNITHAEIWLALTGIGGSGT